MRQLLRGDPVIVLGVHHSGTSILAEVLHRHGVFMQANMPHHESKFFTREINNGLILGGGDRWARAPIMPVDDVLAKTDEVRDLIERRAYRKYVHAGYDGSSRWGFKDPRTCVTLPLFLQVFPGAQLLHIVRDADDVAGSLAANEKAGIGVLGDREHWKALWRQCVERARTYGRAHHAYYEFDYEDLCRQPVAVMRAVFEYLDVPFSGEAERFVAENVRRQATGAAG